MYYTPIVFYSELLLPFAHCAAIWRVSSLSLFSFAWRADAAGPFRACSSLHRRRGRLRRFGSRRALSLALPPSTAFYTQRTAAFSAARRMRPNRRATRKWRFRVRSRRSDEHGLSFTRTLHRQRSWRRGLLRCLHCAETSSCADRLRSACERCRH